MAFVPLSPVSGQLISGRDKGVRDGEKLSRDCKRVRPFIPPKYLDLPNDKSIRGEDRVRAVSMLSIKRRRLKPEPYPPVLGPLMKSTWKYPLAILFLVAGTILAGCEMGTQTPGKSPEVENGLGVSVHDSTFERTLGDPPRWFADMNHCTLEKVAVRMGESPPEPWLSYCDNPRPYPTGTYTIEEWFEHQEELKKYWMTKHGKAQWPSESSEHMKRIRLDWMAKYNLESLSIDEGNAILDEMIEIAIKSVK